MYFKKTSFLVAGLQKSGFASAKFLLDNDAKVYIYDRRKSLIFVKAQASVAGKICCKGDLSFALM